MVKSISVFLHPSTWAVWHFDIHWNWQASLLYHIFPQHNHLNDRDAQYVGCNYGRHLRQSHRDCGEQHVQGTCLRHDRKRNDCQSSQNFRRRQIYYHYSGGTSRWIRYWLGRTHQSYQKFYLPPVLRSKQDLKRNWKRHAFSD